MLLQLAIEIYCNMISALRSIIIFFIALYQFNGIGQGPGCTELASPADGATDIPTDITFEWNAAERATEYVLIAGTTFGGNDILNNEFVGNVTEYMLDEALPAGQVIYVAIVTINENGANGSCEQVQFTTQPSDGLPPCTILTYPEHEAQNISINPSLVWQPVDNADGYLLTIGTTPGTVPLLDLFDVGNITSFTVPNLEQNRTYYFSVVPYNDVGRAENCRVQSSFTTGGVTDPIDVGNRKNLVPAFFTPNNDGVNDRWSVSSTTDFVVQNISVFDRYGKLLLQLEPSQEWDGTINGYNLPSGSYWYAVDFSNPLSVLRGYFLLKR